MNTVESIELTDRVGSVEWLWHRVRRPMSFMEQGNLAKTLGSDGLSPVSTNVVCEPSPADLAVEKVTQRSRSVECVIGAFKYETNSHLVGDLLLGLIDEQGQFKPVVETNDLSFAQKRRITHHLEALRRTRYCSNTPDNAVKCWGPAQKIGWIAVQPALIAEVELEHFIDGQIHRRAKLLSLKLA